MSVLQAGRLQGGGRATTRGLFLAFLLLLSTAAAGEETGLWATNTGDDPRWARPELDDSAWPRVAVLSTWQDQGRQGYDGVVWFRRNVRLTGEARRAADRNELALMLGPPVYGGYEAYAGGRRIGRSRGWSSALPFGFPEVFPVPREAIREDGTVSLALRVRRVGWASDADSESSPVSGVLTLGDRGALEDHVHIFWADHLRSELPLFILAVLFALFSLHHFSLFGRRRKQIEHLWFGLLALAFAANTFASTYWIYELTASRGVAERTASMTGHLAAALAIQFLWTFFAEPISRLLRAYQLSHVALALFVAFWPDLRLVIDSGTVRWLWLIPLLVVATVLVAKEMRRGDAEARVIAIGGVIMIVVEAGELTRNVLQLDWSIHFSLAALGFGALMLAMNLALSFRFRRVHDELDRLRFSLEEEVVQRTRDLAEARDEALAADRAKGQFLANISHEIRTPMNGIIGMAELLLCTPLTAEQQSHLKAIQVSGHSLLTLLNDILDFSRLESERLAVEQSPFQLRSLVEDCIEIMAPLASGKGLTLGSRIAEGTAEAIIGDQNRTRQVLLNLLSNAIKFTPRGGVEVALSARPLLDDQSPAAGAGLSNDPLEVRFSVTDSGPGIADADRSRLFVAFQQLDGTWSRQHGGAGLGLAISKRLTELMGGAITVESAPGRGSTFSFTIVGERATVSSFAPTATAAPAETLGPKPLRVLLAEDEAINRIVVLGMLEQLGYRADSVTSGAEVLQALERETYDVVLMDIQMPGMDGIEVTRRIRGARTDQPHIIALTAHVLVRDREKCLAAGMNDYLSKPLTLDDLRSALAVAERRTRGKSGLWSPENPLSKD